MTTYASYGFTKVDPAAALAAAERLAEGHGREAARRLHERRVRRSEPGTWYVLRTNRP